LCVFVRRSKSVDFFSLLEVYFNINRWLFSSNRFVIMSFQPSREPMNILFRTKYLKVQVIPDFFRKKCVCGLRFELHFPLVRSTGALNDEYVYHRKSWDTKCQDITTLCCSCIYCRIPKLVLWGTFPPCLSIRG
jgi:hypothetical protein